MELTHPARLRRRPSLLRKEGGEKSVAAATTHPADATLGPPALRLRCKEGLGRKKSFVFALSILRLHFPGCYYRLKYLPFNILSITSS
jgi:hypothetical protein